MTSTPLLIKSIVSSVCLLILTATTAQTYTSDISVNGISIGRGGGNLSTNTRVGYQSMYFNTTGESNSAFGFGALQNNTTGFGSSAFGYAALVGSNGDGNTSMGYHSFTSNTSGCCNTGLGFQAGYFTTGAYNFFAGINSGTGITTGSYNTCIGSNTNIGNVSNYVIIADGNGHNRIVVNDSGNVSINGNIRAKKLYITSGGWSDFVFAENYHLKTLTATEDYIKKFKHLPDMPSAYAVQRDGINVAETQALLLRKIEELTLYIIALDKKNNALSDANKLLTKRIIMIEKQKKDK